MACFTKELHLISDSPQAPVVVSAAVVSAVAMSALVPAAQAAQEAFQMAEVSYNIPHLQTPVNDVNREGSSLG